jgi:hypothetical protein
MAGGLAPSQRPGNPASQPPAGRATVPPKSPAPKPPAPAPKPSPKPSSRPTSKPSGGGGFNFQQYVNQALSQLGTPLTDEQIQARAQSYLSPLVQSLMASLGQEAQSGTQAIQGYTSSLANALKGYAGQAQQLYSGAEQSQAASDAALAQRLSGGGADQAQALASRLGSINAPGAVNEAVQAQTGIAQGAGNALYARGSASLADLIARGSAAQEYASKLPGIAGLAGAQQVGQLQGQIANKQAQGIAQLQQQIPGLVQQLETQQQSLRSQRATLQQNIVNAYQTQQARQQQLMLERAVAGDKSAQAWLRLHQQGAYENAQIAQGNARVQQGNARIQQGWARINQDQQKIGQAGAKASGPNASLSRVYGYVVDSYGNPILRNGQRIAVRSSGTAPGQKPLSVSERRRDAATANRLAMNAYNGYTDPSGNKSKDLAPITYQAAVAEARAEGLFSDPRIAKITFNALNRYYKPGGKGGRPLIKSTPAQVAAAAALAPTFPGMKP